MAKTRSKYTEKIQIVEKFLSDEQAKEKPNPKKIEDYNRRIRTFNKAMSVSDPQSNIKDEEFYYGFINTDNLKSRNVY